LQKKPDIKNAELAEAVETSIDNLMVGIAGIVDAPTR
jgi:hypothetical protein